MLKGTKAYHLLQLLLHREFALYTDNNERVILVFVYFIKFV
jgi:hypothetical protein